jgi:hypothetical protein
MVASVSVSMGAEGECLFSGLSADSPTNSAVCKEDPQSFACAIVATEYCADHEDPACALFTPHFGATAGEPLELQLHVKAREYSTPSAVLFASHCACTDPAADCEARGVEVAALHYDASSAVVDMDLRASVPGTYAVCMAKTGTSAGYQQHPDLVAYVQFADARECLFSSEETPCTLDACKADPTSDACVAYTAEYCVDNAEDEGCRLVAVLFRRKRGERATLALHTSILTPRTQARFVADHCSCEDNCTYRAVEVESLELQQHTDMQGALRDGGELSMRILPHLVGTYKLCVSPYGWTDTQDFFIYAATLIVDASDGCEFDGLNDTPCAEGSPCSLDPQSEACALVMAEYCAQHPEDTGCAHLRPVFHRTVKELSAIELHHREWGFAMQGRLVTDEDCDCGSECVDSGIDTLASFYDPETQKVRFDILPNAVGRYKLCVAERGVSTGFHSYEEHIAYVEIGPGESCQFSERGSPCSEPACEDPSSELCAQLTVEYCATSPHDTGCALVVPQFERQAKQATSVSVVLPLLQSGAAGQVWFTHHSCACTTRAEACRPYDVGVLDVSVADLADAVTIELVGGVAGTYRLCASGLAVRRAGVPRPPVGGVPAPDGRVLRGAPAGHGLRARAPGLRGPRRREIARAAPRGARRAHPRRPAHDRLPEPVGPDRGGQRHDDRHGGHDWPDDRAGGLRLHGGRPLRQRGDALRGLAERERLRRAERHSVRARRGPEHRRLHRVHPGPDGARQRGPPGVRRARHGAALRLPDLGLAVHGGRLRGPDQ